ncbi:hypothetical protein [Palaeococcus ferrophilus]|uniref:hypothetical protein n=1 Tax=Palaeococcus ferrophilus TaxID=83868 RepID=UPI00064E23E6|nr:hypothetical protein [Palaeococcus ferrophilus]
MPAPMAGFFALGGMAIVAMLVALVIAGFFLYIGAKWAGIENATLGKAMIAVLGGGILSAIITGIFAFIPVLRLIGWIVGIVVYIWVIKAVFNTDWGKAAIAWLLTIIVEFVVMIILGVLIGVSMMTAFM